MTSDLLSHPLVKRYFNGSSFNFQPIMDQAAMALAILKSMQEPIRKGERYLFCSIDFPGQWVEQTQTEDIDEFHPFKLRLPSRFQEQAKKENHLIYEDGKAICKSCGSTVGAKDSWSTSDPVNERDCCDWHKVHPYSPEGCAMEKPRQKDEVEEKIEFLSGHYDSEFKYPIEKHFRELVALVESRQKQWIDSLKSQLAMCSSENALVHAENLNLEKKANQTKA